MLYAKSSPVETIKEHTDRLLYLFCQIKKLYEKSLTILTQRDWELLKIAIIYHDVGKADLVFQNKIRRSINLPQVKLFSENDVPHNYLSVLAVPFKLFGLNKEEIKLVSQIIAYHHERDILPNAVEIDENYRLNILPQKDKIEKEIGYPIEHKSRPSRINRILFHNRIRENEGELFYKYVILKGLLHRLDHAASAHIPIELATEMSIADYVNFFISNSFGGNKKPLQQFTEQNQNNHVVVVAQTGMGKTEAGLLWLGDKKGFFTLPLRVSINAMYKRITSTDNIAFTKKDEDGGEIATGLLHSTSLDYLYEKFEGNDEVLEKVHSQSKEYANKLVISTVDQILKFPFYYLGFEKEFATLATAKIIIDELQAYDPKIAALLVRAMILIDRIGGSFLIMTATLPDFYFQALKRELGNSKLPLVYGEFIDDSVVRHHLTISNKSILDDDVIGKIRRLGYEKKVLVICNTVDRAREVYEKINCDTADVNLLHARFIQKDRAKKEQEILQFANNDKSGIWVTTQLVEASLDIDFDLLFTEMSSLDSQFQRYGRCNRKGKKTVEQSNVFIYTSNVSGIGFVYHEDIYNRSVSLLSQKGNGILLESEKHKMIKSLYDEEELKESSYKKLFDKTLNELKNRPIYEIAKKDAQELLRDIQTRQVIPIQFSNKIAKYLEQWELTKDKSEKRKIRQKIEQFSLSVNRWTTKEITSAIPLIKGLYFIECDYNSDTGLRLDHTIDPFS